MKLANNLEFNNNQALNMVLQVLAGNHGSPVEGMIWYDSTAKAIKFRDDDSTNTLGVAGSGGDADTLDGQDSTYYLARGNHSGTQTASTISDFDTQVRTSRLDQMANPTTSVDLNAQKLIDVADGTQPTDAVNLSQLQAAVAGLSPKDAVRVATTATGTLASDFENGDTVDGVTLATGDRILIKNQSTASENGIYVVAASGAPTRATDADSEADIRGALVFIEEGSTNANSLWVLSTDAPITVGTTSLSFTQFLAGTAYTWGGGIGISGSTVSVAAGTGLTQDTDGISLSTPVSVANGGTNATNAAGARSSLGATGKYSATVGNGSLTSITVNHQLGTTAVVVNVYRSNAQIWPDVNVTDANNISLVYAVAPTTNQDTVVVIG
jgi:hypothetical protein